MLSTLRTLLRVQVVLAAMIVAAPSGPKADSSPQYSDASALLSGPTTPDAKESPRHDYGPLWGDLDGDGWVDLVFMNHGDFPSLYRNDEGRRLLDRFDASGLQRGSWKYPQQKDRHGAACADYDNDGDLDLFIAHGAMRGETLGVKSDELLSNQGDGTFIDNAVPAGASNPLGRARAPIWLDIDADGWLDLLIGNYLSPNILLRNLGDGTFADATKGYDLGSEGAAHPSWSDLDRDGDADLFTLWPVGIRINDSSGGLAQLPARQAGGTTKIPLALAVAWGDYDGDGRPDPLVTSAHASEDRLFRNKTEGFVTAEVDLGLHPQEGASGAAAGDLDNDGDIDLVVLGRRQVRVLDNAGDGTFVSYQLAAPGLRPGYEGDVALADLDRDGRLDLAISATDGQHLFLNRQSAGAWLELTLRGTRSNADGLGALLTVRSQGRRPLYTQQLGDTGFYKSTSCAPVHLGVGARDDVELEIAWPSGTVQRLAGLPTSRTLVILEPRQ